MKKIASLVAAGVILLGAAIPVFAAVRNNARVNNNVKIRANSGNNTIVGKHVFDGHIRSGDATAYGDIVNDINSTAFSDGSIFVRNSARVRNEIDVRANTGGNGIYGRVVVGGAIQSGSADAESLITNAVNTTITTD